MITLKKGQKVDLTKTNPSLSTLSVKLNWQADPSIDIDTSAFLLGDSGKVSSDNDFVFYGNPSHSSGGVKIESDQIKINLSKVPPCL